MRAKIILPNFIAVLLLGVASYFYLDTHLRERARSDLMQRVQSTSGLFARSEALRGFDLLNDVRTEAMSRNMVETFAPVSVEPIEGETQEQMDKRIHTAWFKKCVRSVELYSSLWQEKQGKRPDLVVVTDRKGTAIARNITPNACPVGHPIGKAMPVVNRALDGEAAYIVWSTDDSPFSAKKRDDKFCQLMNSGLMELAAAPIWYGDDIAGSLVLGFEISNGNAKKNAEMLGLQVAVLKGKEVLATSLATDKARQSLEKELVRADVAQKISDTARSGSRSTIFEIEVEGESFLAQAVPVPTASKEHLVTNLIMGSIDSATEGLGALRVIPVLTLVGLLLVFIVGMVLSYHFMKPIMAIEEGILKVINGEIHYRFDVKSSEVGGLSYRINQMIGALTGEDEDSDMGEEE